MAPPVDSDDEEYQSSEEEDDDTTFHPRLALPYADVRRMPLRDLTEYIDKGLIDLNPEYQRDVVWSSKNMTGLINSILEDYYIPPLIFNIQDDSNPNGRLDSKKRVCVDGKQRLSSVHAFVRGDVPCTDRYNKPWYWTSSEKGARKGARQRQILPENVKSDFARKTFVCYIYQNLTPDQEEDLFARVQKGVELTSAEKIRATSGPWQSLAKLFEQDFPNVVQLSTHDRAIGFRNILCSFAQIHEIRQSLGDRNPIFRLRAEALPSFCKNTEACNDAMRSHLCRVFQTFSQLVEKGPSVFANNNWRVAQKFAPIEIAAVAVLISEHQNARSEGLLLEDIRAMRSYVRKQLSDLRLGHATWVPIWTFISELQKFRGPGDISQPAIADDRSRSASSFSTGESRMSKCASSRTPSSKSSIGPPSILPQNQSNTKGFSTSSKCSPDPIIRESSRVTNQTDTPTSGYNQDTFIPSAPMAHMQQLPDRSSRPPITSPHIASRPLPSPMSPTFPNEADTARKRAFESASNAARERLAKRRQSGTNAKQESGLQ